MQGEKTLFLLPATQTLNCTTTSGTPSSLYSHHFDRCKAWSRLFADLALAASANRAGNGRFVAGLVFCEQHSVDKDLECMAAFPAQRVYFRALDFFVFHRLPSLR
jgi:hypothetical protein